MVSHFSFNVVASWSNPRTLRCWVVLVSGIFIMGMLWKSFLMVREVMVVFYVF